MSNIEPSTSTLRVAPAESDSYFLDQVEFEDDIAKASVWFHKLMIHRIRDIDACARPISQMFSQHDGRFCNRFFYYCRKLKRYKRSDIPRTYIDRDYRIASILVKLLESRADDRTNIRCAERLVNKFYRLITDNTTPLSTEEFNLQIDSYCNLLIETFAKIGDDFAKQENGKKRHQPATPEDVKQIVKQETAPILQKQDTALASLGSLHKKTDRIDNRGRRNNKRTTKSFTDEELESINNRWLAVCNDYAFKYSLSTKGSHADAFNWDRNSFIALRVESAEELDRALHLYSQRKCRKITAKLHRHRAKK